MKTTNTKNSQSTTNRTPVVESLEGRQLFAGQRIFFENFETGGPGWSNDTALSTDSRPAWTVPSGFAHSGSRAAGTTLAGTDAILASPAVNLPSANQYTDHLYLRWWQFSDYASRGGTDFSSPLVRTFEPALGTWGPWNVIDPTEEITPKQTRTWNNVGVDLTLFAGQRVQVGFHHYGFTNGARGWYVDDVEITKEAVQRPWQADTSFENGFDGWTTTRGIWDIGTPDGIAVPSGTKVAGTGLHGSPVPVENSSLISPAFYLPANPTFSPVTLDFKSYLDNNQSAIIQVEFQNYYPSTGWSPVNNISADGGETVLNIYQPAGRWTTMHIPLTSSLSAAHITPHRLLFTVLVGANNGRGWFIDDVKLNYAGKPNQPAPTPIPTPTARPEIRVFNQFGELTDGVTSVLWGTNKKNTGGKDITFTIRNAGSAVLNVGQVVLDRNVGYTIVKQPASTVAAGGFTTFTIRLLTATIGNKSAAVRFATNDSDESPFNFNISGVVKA